MLRKKKGLKIVRGKGFISYVNSEFFDFISRF